MDIAIIGAGLSGCLTALELAERGAKVTVFEQSAKPMAGASLGNEGKIHLGYVFSADETFATARTMIDDALMFRPLVERWMSVGAFEGCLTDVFDYIVPDDSALSPDRIRCHFDQVERYLSQEEARLGVSYLGTDPNEAQGLASERDKWTASRERAVWPAGIAAAITQAMDDHPRIDLRTKATVSHMEASGQSWTVCLEGSDMPNDGPFDGVVNAAWNNRRPIDRKSGFAHRDTWYTRYKFGVLLPEASKVMGGAVPRNATGTLGPYGDSVYYPAQDTLYCSWYPVGMCYSATNDRSDFEVHEAGLPEDLIRKTWAGYATLDDTYEVLAGGEVPDRAALIGGFIVAAGRSDIVDPDSKLHERSGHSARCLAPGYWSLDTGKYTSAPRCAMECAAMVMGQAN